MALVLDTIPAFLSQKLIEGLESKSHSYRPNIINSEFRASQLPYCSRKMLFTNILDYEVSTALKSTSLGGEIIHLLIQTLLQNTDLKIDVESGIELKIDYITIYGHADILILEYVEYVYCFDIKTVKDFKWLNEPKEKHIDQLHIYLSDLVKKYPNKTVVGILWYVLRELKDSYGNPVQIVHLLNPAYWRIFFINFDETIVQKLVAKCFSIITSIRNNVLPTIDAEWWECENKTSGKCPYHHLCYEKPLITVEDLIAVQESKEDKTKGGTRR